MGFIVEVIPSEAVAHVHIDHTPRGQHGFLVRVFETGKQCRDFLNPLQWGECIGAVCLRPNLPSCGDENFWVIILDEFFEQRFGHACRHELCPRIVIDERGKLLNGDVLRDIDVCAVNQQRHTDGDSPQNGDCVGFLLVLLLHLLQACFFLRCALFFLHFLDALYLLIFFVGKALPVDVNLVGFGRSL